MSDIQISISPSPSQITKVFSGMNFLKFLVGEINRLAMNVERFSKQLAPFKTGLLRSRIHTIPARFSLQATVSTGTDYSYYVHWGTGRMRARPFMKEGARLGQLFTAGEIAPRLDKEIADNFKKIGGTGTLPY